MAHHLNLSTHLHSPKNPLTVKGFSAPLLRESKQFQLEATDTNSHSASRLHKEPVSHGQNNHTVMVWILIKEATILGILLSLNEEPQANSLCRVAFSPLSEAMFVQAQVFCCYCLCFLSLQNEALGFANSKFLTLSSVFQNGLDLKWRHRYHFLIGHLDMIPCYDRTDNTCSVFNSD